MSNRQLDKLHSGCICLKLRRNKRVASTWSLFHHWSISVFLFIWYWIEAEVSNKVPSSWLEVYVTFPKYEPHAWEGFSVGSKIGEQGGRVIIWSSLVSVSEVLGCRRWSIGLQYISSSVWMLQTAVCMFLSKCSIHLLPKKVQLIIIDEPTSLLLQHLVPVPELNWCPVWLWWWSRVNILIRLQRFTHRVHSDVCGVHTSKSYIQIL